MLLKPLLKPEPYRSDCERFSTPSALTQEFLDATNERERRALNITLDTAVHFADLNGDGRSEYLWVDNKGAVTEVLNLGRPSGGANAAKIQWSAQATIASGVGKDGVGLQFADLNSDGRAEYLYINTDGSVECWLNAGGPDNGPSAAKVTWMAQGTIASKVGVGRDSVVFAAITGDGTADYIALSETDGSARFWLNRGGPDDGPNAAKVVWLPHGKIADGVGGSGRDVFADLNGDSRVEYLDVKFDTSGVSAWLNGCQDK